jgi:predicted nucleic acid-binding Zn ribbon protein
MNCTKCGASIVADQHFCRDCGAELVPRRPSRVRAAGVAVLALMFVGLMVAMFGKMFEIRWLAYFGLAILMSGAFVIAVYGFLRETRPRRRIAARPAGSSTAQLSVEKVDTTSKLLPLGEDDFIPSVVENTTNLLETPVKRTT